MIPVCELTAHVLYLLFFLFFFLGGGGALWNLHWSVAMSKKWVIIRFPSSSSLEKGNGGRAASPLHD